MREILFRGKRIDNGEWVYGYYARKGADKESFRHYICVSTFSSDYQSNYTYPFYLYDYEVDPLTVGQCIPSLTDKNGKKIFEGDIIGTRIWSEFDDTTVWREGVVVFKNGGYFISLNGSGLDVFIFEERYEEPYFEILGNIHDNPEMLPEMLKGANNHDD